MAFLMDGNKTAVSSTFLGVSVIILSPTIFFVPLHEYRESPPLDKETVTSTLNWSPCTQPCNDMILCTALAACESSIIVVSWQLTVLTAVCTAMEARR